MTHKIVAVATICMLLSIVFCAPFASASAIEITWFRDIVEKRNNAITACNAAWLAYNFWLLVGFENGTLDNSEIFTFGASLLSAYSAKDNIVAIDSYGIGGTSFNSLRETALRMKGAYWPNRDPNNELKNKYINVSNYVNGIIGPNNTLFTSVITAWINRACSIRDNLSENVIIPARRTLAHACDNKIDLADNKTVHDYATAMFLLGKLGASMGVYIGPSYPGENYQTFMGRRWKVPADILSSAKGENIILLNEITAINTILDHINISFGSWFEISGSGTCKNWAKKFSDNASAILRTAANVIDKANDSLNTTKGYNDNGLEAWNYSRKLLREKLNTLRASESPTQRRLADIVDRLYRKAKEYAGLIGWPIED